MNIRHTKPGHTYGVSDYPVKRGAWAPRYATIFPVKAVALEGTYNKAVPRTDYWRKSNGTANGLTVEILQTITEGGDIAEVRLPGMADRIQVKEGNIVVISGRAIHWDEEGYTEQIEHREARDREDREQLEKERQEARNLKDRFRALGLGEWAEVDAYPDMDDASWWPPYPSSYGDWDALLTALEKARGEVKA